MKKIIAILALSIVLSLLSGYVHGVKLVEYPGVDSVHTEEQIIGGFPVYFMEDRLGSSVMGRLHIIEDRFFEERFLLNTAIWFVAIAAAWQLMFVLRRQKAQKSIHIDAK